ncbi:MAG: hypothetical protein JNL58_20365 [Planctomyces sp.]|nr:hypothetical protein [Planctomyces sp.]
MTGARGNPWNRARPKFRKSAVSSDDLADPDAVSLSRIETGRQLAWVALRTYEQTGRFLKDILADLDSHHQLSSFERAAAVDISSGVVRQCRTLDVLLSSLMSRPRQNVESDLWRVLQLGAWQLVFGRTPDHAAVDTTVQLCRALDRERWTGFSNGVLRNLARLLSPDTLSESSACGLPMPDGHYRRLNSDVFADPGADSPKYFAEAFSLPDELSARWHRSMTSAQRLTAGFYFLTPPQVVIRINPLLTTIDEVQRRFLQAEIEVRPGSLPGSLIPVGGSSPERWPGFAEGHWSIQDEAAMHASMLLAPQPGERVLDLCAAPGGKTTHLAELSQDGALITACDVVEGRLDRIRRNVERLGLKNVEVRLCQRDGSDLPEGMFDACLVDVPCSNTGVLNRRPEARWRFRTEDLRELTELQHRLLMTACCRVRPGGRVVYSTCSLEPEENRGVVDNVIRAFPEMNFVTEKVHLPGQPSDGAYQAMLQRAE